MTAMVGFNIVIATVLGLLAVICAVASYGLRRNVPLAWVSAALACGTLQTLVVTLAAGTQVEVFANLTLGPLGFLLAAQSIYAIAAERRYRFWTVAAVLSLTGLAVILNLIGVPYFFQAAAFELACMLAMADAATRALCQPRGRWLDLALAFVVTLLWAMTAARFVALPFQHALDVSVLDFTRSASETLFLMASSLLTPLIIILLLARIIADTITMFQRASERDGLTGLLNRRAFDAMASIADASGGAVIFCDIDHFKLVNDRFGHPAGDTVICTFAALIEWTGHRAARIGGEEFALMLPGQTVEQAVEAAEIMRRRFYDTRHSGLPHDTRLSASFGVAGYGVEETAGAAFVRADSALYAAKEAGRNRVVAYGTAPRPDDRIASRRAAA